MSRPIDILTEDIERLKAGREDAAKNAKRLEERARDLSLQIEALEASRTRILSREPMLLASDQTSETIQSQNGAAPSQGASAAVFDYVLANPGSPRITIIEAVVPKVRSTSRDVGRLVYNTIWQLVNKKKLVEKDGRLYLPEK